jgi:hypothetical protein
MICGPVISFLSLEAAGFSETLLAVYQTLRCPFPEDCTVPVFVRLSAYLLTEFMLGRRAILIASYSCHTFQLQKKNTISHLQVSVNTSRFISVFILFSNCVTYIRIGVVLFL